MSRKWCRRRLLGFGGWLDDVGDMCLDVSLIRLGTWDEMDLEARLFFVFCVCVCNRDEGGYIIWSDYFPFLALVCSWILVYLFFVFAQACWYGLFPLGEMTRVSQFWTRSWHSRMVRMPLYFVRGFGLELFSDCLDDSALLVLWPTWGFFLIQIWSTVCLLLTFCSLPVGSLVFNYFYRCCKHISYSIK